MRVLASVVLALLVMPFASAQPEPGAAKVLRWEYTVDARDPTSGAVKVTIQLSGVDPIIDHMDFLTAAQTYNVSGVAGVGSSQVTKIDAGYRLKVTQDVETLSFTVAVDKAATRAGEYNAYLGSSWGLFRSEAFAIGYSYSYQVGTPFTWNTTMRFLLPSGWSVEGPWQHTSPTSFALPAGETLPRGYVVVGPFKTSTAEGAGKEFRYVKLGADLSYANDVVPFLTKVTPYYENVYGAAADADILVVSAPKPMFTGGLGAPDSLYVNDESELRTLAHEYAHVWQLFGTETRAGIASVWLNEGDAELRSALGLFVTKYWSLEEVNGFLRGYDTERSNPTYAGVTLLQATYGTSFENLAYHKGALVLYALDQLLSERSNGSVGLSDFMRSLNAKHDPRSATGDPAAQAVRNAPVTNDDALGAAGALVHLDLSPFWNEYVTGSDWPTFKAVAPKEDIELTNLTLDPAVGLPGANVSVSVRVENRGIVPSSTNVPLLLDDRQIAATAVDLAVGEERTLFFSFTAPAPGDHGVKSLYLEATFHSMSPARFVLSHASWIPAHLVAGRDATLLVYVQNAGEAPGTVTLRIVGDDGTSLPEMTLVVPGNTTQATSFALRFDTAGPHALTITLSATGAPPVVEREEVAVAAAPQPTRSPIPDAGALVVAAALGGAGLARRKRRE